MNEETEKTYWKRISPLPEGYKCPQATLTLEEAQKEFANLVSPYKESAIIQAIRVEYNSGESGWRYGILTRIDV